MTSTIARPDRGITAPGPLLYLTEPRARLDQLTTRFGQPVSLIASSLGGIYARQLATRTGHAVRQVITLGRPIRLARKGQSQANRLVGDNSHWHIETWDLPLEHGDGPLPVRTTSIYSPLDGIAWRTCLNEPAPQAENIAVSASHLGLGHHPAVIFGRSPTAWRSPLTTGPHSGRRHCCDRPICYRKGSHERRSASDQAGRVESRAGGARRRRCRTAVHLRRTR